MQKIIILVCYLLLIATTTQAQTRGLFVDNGSGTLALARNEKRVALIIGNGNYQYNSKLRNTKNDANDMADALRNLGFDTQLITDATRQEIINGIKNFRNKAAGSSTVALFFYAGHGVQVKGENWIVPTDANPQNESDVTTDCISLSTITDNLNTTGANIIILDACRDNPFTYATASRSNGTRGLAPPQAPNGTYIAFSTAPGTTAADGTGQRNSPYTAALLNALKQPNLPIENTFKQVRTQLKQQGQTPWESSSLTGDFYFNYKETTTTTTTTADSDNDGIIDTKDQCPYEYGDMANYGCPQRKITPTPTPTTNTNTTTEAYTETAAGIALQMVQVQGGTFTMGCTAEQGGDCNDNEKPAKSASVSTFYISKYEVTQAQWQAVMGSNPSYFSDCAQCPVEQVSWDDAVEFCQRLSDLTGKNYTLPTETEWEYAARGGKRSNGYKYAGGNSLSSVAWYTDNSGSKTHTVGTKAANELGLYDMSGNVYEWTSGLYDNNSRVVRGGSLGRNSLDCRVSDRVLFDPSFRSLSFGFRVSRRL